MSWIVTAALAALTWWPAIIVIQAQIAYRRDRAHHGDHEGMDAFMAFFYAAPLTLLVSLFLRSRRRIGWSQVIVIDLPLLSGVMWLLWTRIAHGR